MGNQESRRLFIRHAQPRTSPHAPVLIPVVIHTPLPPCCHQWSANSPRKSRNIPTIATPRRLVSSNLGLGANHQFVLPQLILEAHVGKYTEPLALNISKRLTAAIVRLLAVNRGLYVLKGPSLRLH